MAQEIIVPRLGWSMEEGIFGEWLKPPGEFVAAGEMLYVLEGEKAAHEIESFDSGYLCVPPDAPQSGDPVSVGQVVGFLLAEGESAPASVKKPSSANVSAGFTSAPSELALTEDTEPSAKVSHSSAPESPVVSRAIATPRARRRAQELGVDWTQLAGSGRKGRIRERDVLMHTAESPAARESSTAGLAPVTPGKHTRASKHRLVLAQRMIAGVHQAAPVTLTTKVDASALVTYRAMLKGTTTGAEAPTYNDILIWLTAQTLRDLPELNACWHADGIHAYDAIHIAMAVDTPLGLLAPVIRSADQLTLHQIAEQTQLLIAQARTGQLNQKHLEGGTFTVSNLGTFGIDAFTPILNLPQAGILGMGRIVEEPVVRAGRIEVGQTLTLSLTFDHRVLDGAPAARWLQQLCQRLMTLAAETLR